jgi:phosphate-selective porin
MVKYDWYDPNTDVKGADIGKPGTHLTATDVRYSTWGFGLTYYANENLKVLAYFDKVSNETTGLSEYSGDKRDDVFTLRMQFRF